MRHLLPTLAAVLALAAACGTEADIDTAAGLDADDGQSLDAEAILNFLNGPEATEATLVQDVRIKSSAAASIVRHVRGEDRTLGNGDDNLLQSIGELDAIRNVGPATIRTIDAWLRARGYQPSFEVEGVPFTVDEARAVVDLANTATQSALDDDVGLDARAARAIVAARPIPTVQSLAQVSYVSATALQRMKDWVLSHGVTPPPPPPPVDRTPAVILSATATDATHVVVIFSKPLDPATPGSAFSIFISEPDAGILSLGATIAGAVVTVEMEEQEPGMDYTLEVEASVRDSAGVPVDPQAGRWVHFDGFQGETPPPVDHTPPVMLSAVATDSRHVLVTWSKPIAPTTSAFAFRIYEGSPDRQLGRFSVSFNGVLMSLETAIQVPGTDYTVEADTAVLDVGGTPVEVNGRWAHFNGFQVVAPLPPPTEVDCATLQGGTFDGSSFTAAEECTAVQFLNQARFSEMARFSDSGRRIAYDCAPDQTCGLRSSRWTRLSQFADYPGIGSTTLSGLRTSVSGWTPSGPRWDTVANTWQNRAALAGAPLHFENVAVVGRADDYNTGQYSYACVELRDTTGASNYLRACLQFIGADSAPGCTNDPNACLEPWVGHRASVRGTLRATSAVPGGYVMIIHHGGPGAPNPAAAP